MSSDGSNVERKEDLATAIDEEIRAILADAISQRKVLNASSETKKLAAKFSTCGVTEEELRKLLVKVARACVIAIDI